jgi:hypothetical protein
MLGIGGTATVEYHHTLPVRQYFLMGIAGNHDVYGGGKELLQFGHRPETPAQAVYHADTPAVHIQHLDLFATGIHNGVVVAHRTEHGRKLFQPIQDHGGGQIPAVEDEIDRGKETGWFWPQLIE